MYIMKYRKTTEKLQKNYRKNTEKIHKNRNILKL